jgi:hypothetical protein
MPHSMQGFPAQCLAVLANAALASLALPQDPASVPGSWSSRGGGGGGAFFAPAISPHAADSYAVATDMVHLHRSSDGGVTWPMTDFRAVQAGALSQLQFTSDPLQLWIIDVRDDQNHLRHSTDGGASWSVVNEPTGGDVWWVGADPGSTTRLLIASYTTLYASLDGGATFTPKYTNSGGFYVAGVLFRGNEVYVGTGVGLLQSNDGGVTFALSAVPGLPAGTGFSGFAGAANAAGARLCGVVMNQIDLYPGMTGADYAGYLGVYGWATGQASWQLHTTGIAAGEQPFFAGSSPVANDPTVFWLSGHRFNGSEDAPGVWRSGDGGVTWTQVLQSLNNGNVATGWMGHGGDRGWSYGEFAEGFCVAPGDPLRALVTDLGSIHATSDGGASWRAVYVAPASRNAPGLPTPRGRSYPGAIEDTSCWWLAWPDDNTVWSCMTDVRAWRSTDRGNTWSFGFTGHTENTMYHAVRDPNGVLYGATSTAHDMYQSTYLQDSRIDGAGGRVLQSADQGATWTVVHDFGDPVVWLALDAHTPNRLYASAVNHAQGTGGIWVTDNLDQGGASTWRRLAAPPRTEGHPLTIAVLDDGTLVCTHSGRRDSSGAFTASSGVFVSIDGGASWQDRSHADMQWWCKDLTVDPHDPTQRTFYVGVWSGWGGPPNNRGGLFRTSDRGATWQRLNSLVRVSGCWIDPLRPGHGYVTTETDGLWYSSNLDAPAPTFTQLQGFPFRQPERVLFEPLRPTNAWVTTFGAGMYAGDPQWQDLGLAKTGSRGDPVLCGGGALVPQSEVLWHLERGAPAQPSLLCLGFNRQDQPLLGGTLVPGPVVATLLQVSDGNGRATWRTTMPASVPSGIPVYAQAWLLDPPASQGVAASNAVRAVSP